MGAPSRQVESRSTVVAAGYADYTSSTLNLPSQSPLALRP